MFWEKYEKLKQKIAWALGVRRCCYTCTNSEARFNGEDAYDWYCVPDDDEWGPLPSEQTEYACFYFRRRKE